MPRGSLVLLALACLCSAGFVTCSSPAPVTAWGSVSLWTSSADRKAVSTTQALDELFAAVAGVNDRAPAALAGVLSEQPLTAEQRPDAVVVVASAAESCSAAVQQKLAELTGAATTSLQLPNAVHQGASNPVFAGLRRSSQKLDLKILGNCGGAYVQGASPATAEALKQQLEGLAARGSDAAPLVVVVCPPAADGSDLVGGEQAGSDSEPELLDAAQKLLSSLAPKHIMVHVVHPARATAAAQRGSLKSVGKRSAANRTDGYTVCDATCHKHVMWMQGLIVLIVVLAALVVGCTCMHAVDTPTRFAQAENSRAHQD